jgi:5-methylcytosine-specific restriction endonuclease McrA
MPSADPEKRRAWSRAHYERNRQKYIDAAKRRQDTKRWRAKRKAAGLKSSGNVWKRMAESVNRAAKRGKEYWPQAIRPETERFGKEKTAERKRRRARSDGYESLVVQNALQAWSWWTRVKAPDSWVRDAYRDKPWNNPRLTSAEKWRIRYWCDPSFRAKEIEKVQRTKAKRRKQIDETNDGTLTGDVIVRLFANAKHCHYCGRRMRSVEKSLDHVIPLDRGGAHSIHNVVVACKPCNFSKHTLTVEEWRARAA